MWRILSVAFLVSLTLLGCQAEDSKELQEEKSSYEPLGYEEDGGIDRRGKIPTGKDSYFKRTAEEEFRKSQYNQTNRSHDNDFNNEDAMAVVEKVHELDEVTMAQAFSTDDHMYVAIMVNPYDRRDQSITEKVEGKVREMTDKKITIYTNNNDWDHRKNLNSRLKASEAPDRLKERIRHFFNQE
ncbi:Sporulation lipoprotein YhcN/YlaJ (Spore_YhcN_YlaJ) [Halobacillus dabanensis]|uniref:Sporulation lipoprotein YhcN/YlaJ (Spore_YhcN_YlaJ) n=1 Tax=Halobacillus dabanensis TaxID=240302 RepID=A0A1I3P6N3_HALDA|nr:YhcN/YlaJ family sporulation lipoprotein [Halobacillus dabanensis]SFJ17010.1 Sporulation lipoprotein YhcN/YlaJ (Spore_YhcN_YlaJ) [Halobacillus dabanensis]